MTKSLRLHDSLLMLVMELGPLIATKPLFRWHCLVVFWAYQLEILRPEILRTFEPSLGSRRMQLTFIPLRKNRCSQLLSALDPCFWMCQNNLNSPQISEDSINE
jgi:hypothetical protein